MRGGFRRHQLPRYRPRLHSLTLSRRDRPVTKTIETIIAQALKIPAEEVRDDLEYGSIESWDSLGHVTLMLQIESEYDVEIDEDTMVELTTVRAIKDYVDQVGA